MKKVTICVLLYGDYPDLAMRSLNSILDYTLPEEREIRVGCNACSQETLIFVNSLLAHGLIDCVYASKDNLNKCKMMRRMYKDISTPWIWWFDDDSYIKEPDAIDTWVERAEQEKHNSAVLLGKVFFFSGTNEFDYGLDIVQWIKEQRWYTGKRVPCGVAEHDPNYEEDKFFFVTGGVHMVSTAFVDHIGWPTASLIKRNDDVILCSAVRQLGYKFVDIDYGVGINEHERRGDGEDKETMEKQLSQEE